MKVFGQAVMAAFAKKHTDARKPLARFETLASLAEWRHFPDLKQTFPSADYTPATGTVIINIGGNKCRVLTRVDFELQIVDVHAVLTHKEYNRKKDLKECRLTPTSKCSPKHCPK